MCDDGEHNNVGCDCQWCCWWGCFIPDRWVKLIYTCDVRFLIMGIEKLAAAAKEAHDTLVKLKAEMRDQRHEAELAAARVNVEHQQWVSFLSEFKLLQSLRSDVKSCYCCYRGCSLRCYCYCTITGSLVSVAAVLLLVLLRVLLLYYYWFSCVCYCYWLCLLLIWVS